MLLYKSGAMLNPSVRNKFNIVGKMLAIVGWHYFSKLVNLALVAG